MKSRLRIILFSLVSLVLSGVFSACGTKPSDSAERQEENLYDDTISTSFTVALPDSKGEGLRITYTFFEMKRADTGQFRMTHVYMRHTKNDDTTVTNGTWRLLRTDSGNFIQTYSGRNSQRFDYPDELCISIWNTDSMLADTGLLRFRQKNDNDLRNSTVLLVGTVRFGEERNAIFIDDNNDTLPILKIAAFPRLIAVSDSLGATSTIKNIELLGTIQIRMSMDGTNTQRSLIIEEVLGVTNN